MITVTDLAAGANGAYIALSNLMVAILGGEIGVSCAAVAGGADYVVGDTITLVGGTIIVAAQVQVTAVDGAGAITAVYLVNQGAYTTGNEPPAATTGTGGTGTGATFTLTPDVTGWTVLRDQVHAGNVVAPGVASADREVIIQGKELLDEGMPIGDPGDYDPIVGWRTFHDSTAATPYYNWELRGFTGFDVGLSWEEQIGAAPGMGRFNGTSLQQATAYLHTRHDVMPEICIFIEPHRIILGVRALDHFGFAYLGHMLPIVPLVEYPYPMMVSGSHMERNGDFLGQIRSGMNDPRAQGGTYVDPDTSGAGFCFVRTPTEWRSILHQSGSSGGGQSVIFPFYASSIPTSIPLEDVWMSTSFPNMQRLNIWTAYAQTAASHMLEPSPTLDLDDWPSAASWPLVDAIFYQFPSRFTARLDGVFGTTFSQELNTGHRLLIDDDYYSVFRNGNHQNAQGVVVIKEL